MWQCWQEGRYAGAHFAGDQNFIFRVFQELAPAALAYWPAELVRSYKVLRKLASRDAADSSRQTAPLVVAPGATRLDTSNLTIDGAVDAAIEILRHQGLKA